MTEIKDRRALPDEGDALRAPRAVEIRLEAAQLAAAEADRRARIYAIRALAAMLAEADSERSAYIEDINYLVSELSELSGHNAARLDELKQRMAQVAETESPSDLGDRKAWHSASTAQPIGADDSEVLGLLHVVEAQASELAQLRQALTATQNVAAFPPQPMVMAETRTPGPTANVVEWVCSIALAEITRLQNAIADAQLSRWRRLGQHLGLAKRFNWEARDWRVDLVATPSSPADRPPTTRLLDEIARLNGLLYDLRTSRWRKLGQRLGLAKRFDWELGAWPCTLLLAHFPSELENPTTSTGDLQASTSSYLGFIEYVNQRFLEECRDVGTDVIFDVGANTGQFAQGLRARGYRGRIVSFEPLSDAHAVVSAAAASDPLWDVAERFALGAADGWAEINIAGNSYSSSLLPMLDLHRAAAPESAYQGSEPCKVVTLDSYIEWNFPDPQNTFGLKIDTQGYEAEVLAGLKRHHDQVKVIVCEMSLAPLYANGPSMSELAHLLAELGYRCVALGPEFEDPRNGELLQVNGVFVKRN